MSEAAKLDLPAGRILAYYRRNLAANDDASRGSNSRRQQPGIVFLGGFASDMTGTKAMALDAYCAATGRPFVRFDPRPTSPEALVSRVVALGFAATPYDPASLERPAREQSRAALVRLLVAAFLAMNVMWLSIALYFGALQDMEPDVRRALRWLVIVLSVPAVAWCAAPFWRGAWKGLRRRELTLDLPVVLGIATALAANVVGTLGGAS